MQYGGLTSEIRQNLRAVPDEGAGHFVIAWAETSQDRRVMNSVFRLVADGLIWIAGITGLTYNEVNIIAYYMVLPFLYLALLDRLWGRHVLKAGFLGLWALLRLLIGDFSRFSDRLFGLSQDFLRMFEHIGLDYIEASVVICVLLPGLILAALCVRAFPGFPKGGSAGNGGGRRG